MIAATACFPPPVRPSGNPDRWCELGAGDPVPAPVFDSIRRQAVLEGCKWDPQVGDVQTLADFPLLASRSSWKELTSLAEQLAAETMVAEREVLARPELLRALGLPRRVLEALRRDGPPTPAAARVMRFDFHLTPEGWRISEVNSDVPGGFTEASFFTRLMARHYPNARQAGVPVTAWADALARTAGPGGVVALLSAPGYMEDHQIVVYLARELQARGCRTHLANPAQLRWQDGYAYLETAWSQAAADVVVRFYQGEWLAGLRKGNLWHCFFRDGRTPVGNPGSALISESKRFPLLWDRLRVAMPTWRARLPETRDPRQAPWPQDPEWLVKAALSNTGDEVCLRELVTDKAWARVRWSVRLFPGKWVAQKRFESVRIRTPRGLMHACVGVYTVDGKAAGAYGRLAPKALIDFAAVDAAFLVEHDEQGKPA